MNKNIVLWGQVGVDQKALLAIHLNEEQKEVQIYAYPKDEVDEKLQNSLFAWKNGTSFDFSNCKMTWNVDAQGESILPRDVRVDKPEFIQRAQIEWGKLMLSSRIFAAAKEEVVLHKTLVSSTKEFDQNLWTKTQELWTKYSSMLKEREITWEHAQLLKAEIDEVFDIMKTLRTKQSEAQSKAIKQDLAEFEKQIEQFKAQTIYPDEWPAIHDGLKKVQEEIKQLKIRFQHKKPLFKKIDEVYQTMRSYRETQNSGHIKSRLENLHRILRNTKRAIARDAKDLELQKDKLAHYIKGQDPSQSQWGGLLKPLEEKLQKSKEKAEDIQKTIKQLEKSLADAEKKAQNQIEAQEKSKKEKQAPQTQDENSQEDYQEKSQT